jgi:hypothetical protein
MPICTPRGERRHRDSRVAPTRAFCRAYDLLQVGQRCALIAIFGIRKLAAASQLAVQCERERRMHLRQCRWTRRRRALHLTDQVITADCCGRRGMSSRQELDATSVHAAVFPGCRRLR